MFYFVRKPAASLLVAALTIAPAAGVARDHGHSHDHNHGEGVSYPRIHGHLDVMVHLDSVVDASDTDDEINESYSHSHANLGIQFNPNVSVNTKVKLEGHDSGHNHHGSPDGNNQYFNDHELFVETLTVNFDNEHAEVYAGKFNPVIGIDYHAIPGIYGYQEVESYAVLERIGAGVGFKMDGGNYGQHRLDVSSFFADTTALSDSLINQRGYTHEEDGGVSNTEDFSSYAVSLGGEGFRVPNASILDGLFYRLGYAKQAKGEGDANDETRYVVGGGYNFNINDEVTAKLLTEFADINHRDGTAMQDRSFATVALGVYYQGWNAATSFTAIDNNSNIVVHNHDGQAAQVSVGYDFDNGFGIDVGYKKSDIDNEKRDTVGTLLRYSMSF